MHNKWCGNPKNGIIAKNANATRQSHSSPHVLRRLYILSLILLCRIESKAEDMIIRMHILRTLNFQIMILPNKKLELYNKNANEKNTFSTKKLESEKEYDTAAL